MNLLSLTASALFLLSFATACEVARIDPGSEEIIGDTKEIIGDTKEIIGDTKEIIGDTKEIIEHTKEIIGHTKEIIGATEEVAEVEPNHQGGGRNNGLTDRLKKMEKEFREFQNRYKNLDNQLKEFKEQQESILDTVELLRIQFSECCPAAPPVDRILTVDADDSVTLYLDGKEIKGFKNANDWRIADSTPLPSDTQVIAVKGRNHFGDPGVLASTEDGYVLTNTTWKCSNQEVKGWETADFDDSQWPNAFVVLPARRRPIKGIRDDTSWIWTKNFKPGKGDKKAYCRLKLQ